jgi:hypothetical protein
LVVLRTRGTAIPAATGADTGSCGGAIKVIELDLYQKNADAEDFLDVPKLIRIFDR